MKIVLVFIVLSVFSCGVNNNVDAVEDWPRHIDSLDKIWSEKDFELRTYWYVRQPGDEGTDEDTDPIVMDFLDSTKFLRFQIIYSPPFSYFSRTFYLNDSTWKRASYSIVSNSGWKSSISADTTFRLPNVVREWERDSLLNIHYFSFLKATSTATFSGISYSYNKIFAITTD